MEPSQKQSAELGGELIAQPAALPPEEKHNTASRVIAATFFAKLFAGAINNIGQVTDASRVMKNKDMTFKEKVYSLFTPSFWKELLAQHKSIRQKYPTTPVKGFFIATNNVFKYTIITSVIGGTIGAVLGWSLGDRIKNSEDLYKHPWQSTKILLGITKPDAEPTAPTMLAQDKKPEQEKTTKWQDYAKERQTDSAAIGKAV